MAFRSLSPPKPAGQNLPNQTLHWMRKSVSTKHFGFFFKMFPSIRGVPKIYLPGASRALATPPRSKSISGEVKKYTWTPPMSGISEMSGFKTTLTSPRRLKSLTLTVSPLTQNLISQSEAKTKSKSMMISSRPTFLS
jgi:hypothetical protein